MKPTLFVLSIIVTLIMSSVTAHELTHDVTKHGTAVIAAKSKTKGGTSSAVTKVAMTDGGLGKKKLEKPVLILPPDLTPKQGELLTYAYQVAKADGLKHPEYYQGLIYQESKAGGMKGYQVAGQEFGLRPMQRYYGVPQIKLAAAKDVLKQYPFLGAFQTDEEIVAKLITDDKWAIRVGSKYLTMICQNKSPEQQLVCYNKGEAGARGINPSTNDYAQKIIHHVHTVVAYVNSKNQAIIAKFSRHQDTKLASAE